MHLILSINNRVVCLLRIVLEAVSQSVQKLIRPAQSPMIVGPTCSVGLNTPQHCLPVVFIALQM